MSFVDQMQDKSSIWRWILGDLYLGFFRSQYLEEHIAKAKSLTDKYYIKYVIQSD